MSLSSCLQEGHRWSQGEGGIWRPREVICHYEQHNVAQIVGWEQLYLACLNDLQWICHVGLDWVEFMAEVIVVCWCCCCLM